MGIELLLRMAGPVALKASQKVVATTASKFITSAVSTGAALVITNAIAQSDLKKIEALGTEATMDDINKIRNASIAKSCLVSGTLSAAGLLTHNVTTNAINMSK